jgi:hypothetical protein
MRISLTTMILNLITRYEAFLSDHPQQRREYPMDAIALSRADCPAIDSPEQRYMSTLPYRNIIGSLIFISISVRVDISYAVHRCSRFMSNPGLPHWNALLNILIYLRTYPDLCIQYTRDISPNLRNIIIANVDADHAGDPDDRCSTTGLSIFMNNGPIAWSSTKQDSASGGGTAESEYKAIYKCGQEIIALRQTSEQIGYPQPGPTVTNEDNQPAIDFAHNPIQQSLLKHVETKYHQTRFWIQQKFIHLNKVPGTTQCADILTKPLTGTVFRQHRATHLHSS